MYQGKTFLAIIPARGGSKRLPKKNILQLNNKPLIAYSIEASKKSKYIDKTIVSSDCQKIVDISLKLEVDVIIRPVELASDTATTFDAVKHTIDNTDEYDFIVLLQPTSPLRTSNHIDEAIELLLEKKGSGIISVSELEHSPLWSNTLPKDHSMENFIKQENTTKRSQDLDKYFRLNGSIFITNKDKLISEKTFYLKENTFAYIMPKEVSIDIDDKFDFMIAESILTSKLN